MTTDTQLVTLTINGRQVQATKGRLLIDVAEEMSIFVPRFCYHPGMRSVAVCRMCLVKIEGGRKLVPACATPVDEGMVAHTNDPEAVDAQRGMLEFLLINHPLDCPICDRAGECPLQDQTYRHGPGGSRYIEPKRTYEKALEISELVVLDRERCVLCWRCVRFCDEISGDSFIELVDRGAGTQILTFSDEPFNSYFSGNTVQICPVGALLARPYRFVSRPWDLESAPSVCGYCAVGCPLDNESRADKMVRCQALPNERVNDFWICDKGRFGYHYVSSDDRLDAPLVRDGGEFRHASWGEAYRAAADKLRSKDRVGVIAGGHLPTEDAYAIGRLAKKVIGTPHVDSRIQDVGAAYELALDAVGVAGSTARIEDLHNAGTIVWVGPDPREVLPVLFLQLRKAVVDNNAELIVVSPRRLSLDSFATRVVRTYPGREAAALDDLGDGLAAPVIVCWSQASSGRDESEAFSAALGLATRSDSKLLVGVPHAGSQGMIDMGVHPSLDAGYRPAATPGRDTRAMLEAAAAGELDTLLIFGADLVADFPDQALARRALESKVFTIVIELFPTETVSYADVVLPSAAYAEREGTFTNLERRLQKLEPLVPTPGTAIESWKICEGLARELGQTLSWDNIRDVWKDIRKDVPTHTTVDLAALRATPPSPSPNYETGLGPAREALFEPHSGPNGHAAPIVAGPGAQYPKGFRSGAPFQTGQNWPLSWELRAFEAQQRPGVVPFDPRATATEGVASAPSRPDMSNEASPRQTSRDAASADATPSGTFALITGRFIYDQGSMVSRTAALHGIAKRPFVEINPEDADRLGLGDGDDAVVRANGTEARLKVVVADIVPGTVFVPYDQPGFRANQLLSNGNEHVEVARA